jgi:hypothetical protein
MLNWDTLGQIEVLGPDDGTMLAGASPDGRAAAVIIAPGLASEGQDRSADSNAKLCGGNYVPANYLHRYQTTRAVTINYISGVQQVAAATPINNGAMDGVINPDVSDPTQYRLTRLIAGPVTLNGQSVLNETMAVITPSDIFDAVTKRSDFLTSVKKLTQNLATCIAQFPTANADYSTGDRRLPMAAPLTLPDYADPDRYADNLFNADLGGRFPYTVSASKARTGNSMTTKVLTEASFCPVNASAFEQNLYANWKDQFFLAVAGDFSTTSASPAFGHLPSGCNGKCLKIVGSPKQFTAIVLFGDRRLSAAQTRNAYRYGDKGLVQNYFEGRNATNGQNSSGDSTYEYHKPASASSADILYCVDDALMVAECPAS